MFYKHILRPFFFRFDSERVHHIAIAGAQLAELPWVFPILSRLWRVSDPILRCKAFGLEFENPLGLGAGFDKDVQIVPFLSAIGFGHVEVGTITPEAQPGNPLPRIFRLTEDEALVNRMGFPSSGAEHAIFRFQLLPEIPHSLHVAVNIGKNKETPLHEAASDYAKLSEVLSPYGAWLTINVSSPNTPGLRSLQTKEALTEIVTVVREHLVVPTPILVKLSPDLTPEQLEHLIHCFLELEIDGVIASNTTLSREGLIHDIDEEGGLSGRPLFARTREIVQHITRICDGAELPIIAVGGVTTWQELLLLLIDGATLVQAYTAFIYEGPGWPKQVLKAASRFCRSQGISSIHDLRGRMDLVALLLEK